MEGWFHQHHRIGARELMAFAELLASPDDKLKVIFLFYS
jgi:hypothetical protein